MNVRKWVSGGVLAVLVTGGSVLVAGSVGADPAGAPNNTGTGQTAASNSTGSSGSSGGGYDSSQSGSTNNGSSSSDTAQQAADTYNGGVNGEGEFGGTDSVQNAAETPSSYADNDHDDEPGSTNDRNPSWDTLPLAPGLNNFFQNLLDDLIGGRPPAPDFSGEPDIGSNPMNSNDFGGALLDQTIASGGGGGGGNWDPMTNTPTKPENELLKSNCRFSSGTHNLADTRAMFPGYCGQEWDPIRHKCDYDRNTGWHCYRR